MKAEFDLQKYAEEVGLEYEAILAEHPGIHPVTAHVMAGDRRSMRVAREAINAGEVEPLRGMHLVGSYYRWDFAVDLWRQRRLTDDEFFTDLAALWRGADPDDTKSENLRIWGIARRRNNGYVRDGRPLPKGDPDHPGLIRVYRGGAPTVESGIAWTTDPKVARKFALGASLRAPMARGEVMTGRVLKRDVLAYITLRHEAEVIVDPRLVMDRSTSEVIR